MDDQGSTLINRTGFRRITPGIEILRSSSSLPRHRHLRSYVTVVLAGSLEESGYVGRLRATAGDVMIHPALDCHANPFVSAGVKLIRLEWRDTNGEGSLYRLNDVDELARATENDVVDAALLLKQTLSRRSPPPPGRKEDWPDLLAITLAQNASMEIGDWAEANGLARETVSRGFAAAYEVAPTVFQAELRARAAWLRITRGSDPRQRHIDTLDEEEEQVDSITLTLETLDQPQVASTRERRIETKGAAPLREKSNLSQHQSAAAHRRGLRRKGRHSLGDQVSSQLDHRICKEEQAMKL